MKRSPINTHLFGALDNTVVIGRGVPAQTPGPRTYLVQPGTAVPHSY